MDGSGQTRRNDEYATTPVPGAPVYSGSHTAAGEEPASVTTASSLTTARSGRTDDLPPSVLDITALDLGGDVVFITDRDGIIVDVNDAFVRVTGYSRQEAIGETPRLLNSGQQDEAFYRELWETVLAGKVWEGELVDRRRDGTLRTHRATITPVRDGSGQVTHFVAIERDISSELARQVGAGSSGLVHTDLTGRCIYADSRAGAVLEVRPADLLGTGFLDRLAPEDADELREVVSLATDTGREHRLDLRTVDERWLHVEVGPLSVPSGTTIGARCTVEDITDRVFAHRELARRDAFLSSVLDALDTPVGVVSAEGVVLALNRAWREHAAGEGANPLSELRIGVDVTAVARRAASSGYPLAERFLEDLRWVLSGRGRARPRTDGVQVNQLAWDEGGAVLVLRG